jgi:DNA-directed RNA polymerase subunit RPC12/RpoP
MNTKYVCLKCGKRKTACAYEVQPLRCEHYNSKGHIVIVKMTKLNPFMGENDGKDERKPFC